MIATIGFVLYVSANTGYSSIFDDDGTASGPTATCYYPSDISVHPAYLYHKEMASYQKLLNISNAARSIEVIVCMARNYTCKVINKMPSIRISSIIKMMFSHSGYLPWRLRRRLKDK